jgi:hypothetical protein
MGIILILLVLFWIVGTLAQMESFKYYSDTYEKLDNGTVVFDYEHQGLYYFCTPPEKGNYLSKFIIFTSGGRFSDVKVGPWDYLHGDVLIWISPYSLYWWFKYKDWFEKNKDKFVN